MKSLMWPIIPLGDCAKFLSGGTPSKDRAEFWEGDIPWVGSGELTESRICDAALHITPEAAKTGSRLVPENTVLVVVRGMSLAKEFRVSIAKHEIAFNQDLKAFKCKPDVDPEFLFYALFAQREHIRQLATEASHGTKKLETDTLARVGIPLPTKPIQHRTVEIVIAYDDLIENNRRRMALLEESARLLYREWFVQLRFPGHARTRVTDGVPKGWERKTLGDICDDIRDLVLPSQLEPDTPYIGLEHMPRRSISLTEWETAAKVTSSKFRYSAGDILFGKIRPYFHKTGITFTDGVASSDAIVIRPNSDDLRSFVLMTVSSDEFVADTSQSMKEGSKMPRADWKQMIQHPVLLPPQGLLNSFSGTVETITSQLRNLCFQNQKLRTARDLLLPRLMSGEIAP